MDGEHANVGISGTDAPSESSPATTSQRIGQRNTRQRRAVVASMQGASSFRSAADIHKSLTEGGEKVGLTTVYRTLQSLAEMNVVDVLHISNGEAVYRLCGDHHHHHLVCTDCGATIEIPGGPVEEWASSVAARNGFMMTDHSAEVFGLCGDCQSKAAS